MTGSTPRSGLGLADAEDENALLADVVEAISAVGHVRLLLGEGVSGWVARNSEPVTIADGKESDPRYRYFPELRGEEFTSMASVPMASRPSGRSIRPGCTGGWRRASTPTSGSPNG